MYGEGLDGQNAVTTTYTYDASGMRTRKVVADILHESLEESPHWEVTSNNVEYSYVYNGSLLMQETIDTVYQSTRNTYRATETLFFSYDESGNPLSVRYARISGTASVAEATYYYVTNAQSDVTALVNASGSVVVQYSYDAYGNLLSTTGSMSSRLGSANPLRYRGYVYDNETGFYYVSSRYYNPAIGRWINADLPETLNADFENFAQYNLFVYCFNNPVNMNDQSGHWPKWLKNAVKAVASVVTQVKAVLSIPSTVVKIAAASTVAVISGQATVGDVVNDVKNYSFFNTDETKVLNSKVFSSYKGTPVLKHDISGVTSFSVSNTIILNKAETVSNGGVDTVKHEWGHTVQQSLIGTQKYMTQIAAPSVISCIINPSSITYYSLPWERSADFFGGASRTTGYHAGSDVVAGLYLIIP